MIYEQLGNSRGRRAQESNAVPSSLLAGVIREVSKDDSEECRLELPTE